MARKLIKINFSNSTFCFLFSKFLFIFLFFVFYFLIFASTALAATLYLEPSMAEYHQNEIFVEDIRVDVDNENEDLNAFEIYLKYPAEIFKIIDIDLTNSILNFVVEKPTINQEKGIIYFSGIVPGGYRGRLFGDPGISNLLAKIIFQVKELTLTEIPFITEISFLDTSRILLNDGQATSADLKTNIATIKILSTNDDLLPNQFVNEAIRKDKRPPEYFQPQIVRHPDIYDNQWFLVFHTQDKESGIDYYEIQETKEKQPVNDGWRRGESPYLLEDQTLTSNIFIKAIDRAGNYRLAEVIHITNEKLGYKQYIFKVIIIVICLIVILLLLFKLIKLKIGKKNEKK